MLIKLYADKLVKNDSWIHIFSLSLWLSACIFRSHSLQLSEANKSFCAIIQTNWSNWVCYARNMAFFRLVIIIATAPLYKGIGHTDATIFAAIANDTIQQPHSKTAITQPSHLNVSIEKVAHSLKTLCTSSRNKKKEKTNKQRQRSKHFFFCFTNGDFLFQFNLILHPFRWLIYLSFASHNEWTEYEI